MSSTLAPSGSPVERLVSRLFSVIDGCRWDELHEVFTAECVCHRPGAEPLVGLPSVEDFYRHQRPIASGEHRLERVIGDGEVAACWGRFVGQDTAGRALDVQFAEVFTFHGDRVAARRTYLHGG